jgi:hypothetical protein
VLKKRERKKVERRGRPFLNRSFLPRRSGRQAGIIESPLRLHNGNEWKQKGQDAPRRKEGERMVLGGASLFASIFHRKWENQTRRVCPEKEGGKIMA